MRVYKITNKQNGKLYIGQTKMELYRRFGSHLREAKYGGSTSIIHNAIRKYGKDAFEIELLQECQSFEELDEAERRWIAELNTIAPNGYNIEVGGCRNRAPMSEATRAKLRQRRSPETIEKIRHAARNRSPEWRRRLSESRKHLKPTPKQLAALAAGAKLRHVAGTTTGEDNGRAILTWDKVSEIRELYATGDFSQEKLGILFGVKQVTISAIVRHKIWRLNTLAGSGK